MKEIFKKMPKIAISNVVSMHKLFMNAYLRYLTSNSFECCVY